VAGIFTTNADDNSVVIELPNANISQYANDSKIIQAASGVFACCGTSINTNISDITIEIATDTNKSLSDKPSPDDKL
jgi:hypothetical protein